MNTIKVNKAYKIFSQIFESIHVSKKIYDPIIKNLINSSLRGVDSHGIRLMRHYVDAAQIGRINKQPKIKFKKTSPSTFLMDADHTFGIYAGIIAINKAIETAKKTGISAVAVKNSSHFAAAEIFSLQAAEKGMIGISLSNTESFVIPFGGKKPFLGTNPISIAIPCKGEEPICLDMATSSVAWNKIKVYEVLNKTLEDNWVVDENGNDTNIASKAKYLKSFGSYKGYGLGLVIAILCTFLNDMKFDDEVTPMFPLNNKKRKLGHFFIVIDISKFTNLNKFKNNVKNVVVRLRRQPSHSHLNNIIVAGDDRKKIHKERKIIGIPLTSELKKDINYFEEIIKIKK